MKSRIKKIGKARALLGALGVVSLTLSAAATAGGASAAGATPRTHRSSAQAPALRIHHGGTLTVLEEATTYGAWPQGFDPGTATEPQYNQSMMNAIFGQLFELGRNGNTIDDLATGYSYANGGRTLVIDLRQGVKFSDGTPFDAAAVVWNYQRDFASSTCTCKTYWPVAASHPFVARNRYTVVVNFAHPFAPALAAMQAAQMNWIASPTAYRKMGEEQFRFAPVGAGPFVVVKDIPSNELVVKKNRNYWQVGHPYLNGVIFKASASGQPTLDAMEAGQAQVAEGVSSTTDLGQYYARGFYVDKAKSDEPYTVQLNTLAPPFNNPKARLALAYATNAKAIDKELFNSLNIPVQSFTGPGGLFYMPNVSGYPTYNLDKAKALVKQLGGLSFSAVVPASSTDDLLLELLQSQWAQAGMQVTLTDEPLPGMIQLFLSHKYQAVVNTTGALDPAIGAGVNFRFLPGSIFDGVNAPTLTQVLLKAESTLSPAGRQNLYAQAAKIIAKNAYMLFLFTFESYTVAKKGVTGPGITSAVPMVDNIQQIKWQDVFLK